MKFLKYPLKQPYKLNQRFDNKSYLYSNIGLAGHNGIDFATPTGTPILAMHDGIILNTVVDNKGGLGVEIRSKEKIEIDGKLTHFKTLYWHLDSFSCHVGQEVKAGDIIGISGNTGNSTGPHLHNALKLIDDNFNTLNHGNGYNGAIDHLNYIDFGFKYNFTKPLKIGSKGEEVLALQEVLTLLGYFNRDDKYSTYGQKTNIAVRTLQILLIGENNLQPSYLKSEWRLNKSLVGGMTLKLLNKLTN